jgi:hypothetical protein
MAQACAPGTQWECLEVSLPCKLGSGRTASQLHGTGQAHGEGVAHGKASDAR